MKKPSFVQSLGLLILRASFGASMLIAHGYPKFTKFQELSESFSDPLGMGSKWSLISALGAEMGCAALLVLGLATRVVSIPLAFTMGVALLVIHGDDPWEKKELAAAYFAVFTALVFTGGGVFSLDHLIWGKKADGGEERPRKDG